jgi:O-antigen/teichoic acid export membrane protein
MFKLIFVRKFLYKLQGTGNDEVLARGTIGTFIVKVVGAGLLFGLHILLARLLGVTQYGTYVYTLSWINILLIPSTLGLDTSLVRFIPAYKVQGKWGLLRGILHRSSQLVIILSLLVSSISITVVWYLRENLHQSQVATFYISFIMLPVLALTRMREAGLRALRKVVKSELLMKAIRPAFVAIIVGGLYSYRHISLQATHAMAANFMGMFAALLFGTVWLSKTLPESVSRTPAEYDGIKWIKVSLPLLLITGMYVVLSRTGVIMIGLISGPDQAGTYRVALSLADLVVFGLMATNAIAAPMISELYSSGQHKELQRVMTLAARYIFIFTLVICIIIAISGKYLLALFGKDFVVGYIPLLILLGGQLVNALAGSVGFLMTMTRYQNEAGLILVVSAALNIILNIMLIPSMGLIGAAISTSSTMVLWNFAMLFYVHRKLGINPTVIRKY